ncbi:MAG TPA: ABC transporter permease [Methylomirabilota bacterium]|jgi:NitT/TauT family transport system permease protein/taurine transport system permease protein|nr:ABC transporter permease [Methylomirabilota bacterium]
MRAAARFPGLATSRAIGLAPFVVVIAAWLVVPMTLTYPRYVLPPVADLGGRLIQSLGDGSLLRHTAHSLLRLLAGFLVGNALAIPLGIAIALNRRVADLLRPVLTFLQSIAGIAWIPLAIVWFGIGDGAVVFVIANIIFFSVIYNTVIGVQTIPRLLRRAVQSHGGQGFQIFTELILPGALVQIILGLRTSVALGWRALVAAEMLAGASGLGYMTIEAVQWYKTDVVLLGMILIGLLWLALDRLLFVPLERATVLRWGIVQR